MTQSGLTIQNHILNLIQNQLYIYGSYYTSILYYTGNTPTQVFVDTTDDNPYGQQEKH